jgi:hypothetical protein
VILFTLRSLDASVLMWFLKSLFMRVGRLSDDLCNHLNPKITMKVTVLNIPWCVDSTLYHFVLIVLNHFNIRITGAGPKLDT